MKKEIWKINLATAKRCLIRKLTLKEINELTRDNITQICSDKNIQLTLID